MKRLGNNVQEQTISPTEQSQACLSDEQILKLSTIGVTLEKLYGNARDIEWAVHKVGNETFKKVEKLGDSVIAIFSGYDLPTSIPSNHNSTRVQ